MPVTPGQRWPRAAGDIGSDITLPINQSDVVDLESDLDDIRDDLATVNAVYEPRKAPVSPSAYDDEFVTASLAGIWTQVTTPGGGFTVTYNKNGTVLTLDSPGAASNNILLLRQAIGAEGTAGTLFWVTFRCFLVAGAAGTIDAVLEIGDNSTLGGGNFWRVGIEQSGTTLQFVSYDGGSVNLAMTSPAVSSLWVTIQRDTSNAVRIYLSFDGETWKMVRGPVTDAWDIDYLFLYLAGDTSTSNPSSCGFDFVRVNDPRFKMPL